MRAQVISGWSLHYLKWGQSGTVGIGTNDFLSYCCPLGCVSCHILNKEVVLCGYLFFSLVGLIILALKTALRYISSFSNDVLAASEVHYCRAAPVTAFRNPVFSRDWSIGSVIRCFHWKLFTGQCYCLPFKSCALCGFSSRSILGETQA